MPDFRITIDMQDLGAREVDDIASEIEDTIKAELGEDVQVRVSQKVGDNYFGREPGDDLIES